MATLTDFWMHQNPFCDRRNRHQPFRTSSGDVGSNPPRVPREKHDLDQRRGPVVMNDYQRVRVLVSGREAGGINPIGEDNGRTQ